MIFTKRSDPHARYIVELDVLNKAFLQEDFIDRCEAYYNEQVEAVARDLVASGKKILLLAGPSGSGKTTTAMKLTEALKPLGCVGHVISLDNFFVGKGLYPKLPDGRDDFESIDALHLELFHTKVDDLLSDGTAWMPEFDFAISDRHDDAYELVIGEQDIVIFEGIHALNPRMMPEAHQTDAYRLYISPKCRVTVGDKVLLSGRDLRQARRSVRDFLFRNYTHQQTARIWDNVCEGERLYIQPFSRTADACIDTTHFFEYGLYAALLRKATPQPGFEKETVAVDALQKRFESFTVITPACVPFDSMVREFIGGNSHV